MHVFDTEGDLPPFAYSIGIQQETGAPEVVVIGLKRPMAHSVINEYNNRVREGERFEVGKYYEGFLEGFEIYIGAVPPSVYSDYFGQNIDFYDGRDFQVLRLSIRRPKVSGHGPTMPQSRSFIGNLCLQRRARTMPLNMPIDTDQQQQEAASPQSVVVRSSSR
ncbi:MAG: DUF4262 domain-containing protein [Rhodoferax sp.]|nr:DUF4262 domain-containing protein [Rhodoferax sp.]